MAAARRHGGSPYQRSVSISVPSFHRRPGAALLRRCDIFAHAYVHKERSMHEVDLMQRALDIALERAVQRGAQRIHRITFRVGAEAGVVPEVIEMAFTIAIQGTLAAGAQLA